MNNVMNTVWFFKNEVKGHVFQINDNKPISYSHVSYGN